MHEWFHFGVGRLGLGLVVPKLSALGIPCTLLNRADTRAALLGPAAALTRNSTLQSTDEYCICYDRPTGKPTAHERVKFARFIDYTPGQCSPPPVAGQTNTVLVSCSLANVAAYNDIWAFVGALEKNPAIERIYVFLCENSIDKQSFGDSISHLTKTTLIDTIVDRMCSVQRVYDGRVFVHTEPYEYFVVESNPDLDTLLQGRISVTADIRYERMKKLFVYNGSHALVAIHAAYHKFSRIDLFLTESNSRAALSPQQRLELAYTIMYSQAEAFGEWAKQNNASFDQHRFDEEIDDFVEKIITRMCETFDTTARVLSRLNKPDLEGSTERYSNPYPDLFTWLFARLVPPANAYVLTYGSLPPPILEAAILLLKMIQEGRVPKTDPVIDRPG